MPFRSADEMMRGGGKFFLGRFGRADVHFFVKLPAVGGENFCLKVQRGPNGKGRFSCGSSASYDDEMF